MKTIIKTLLFIVLTNMCFADTQLPPVFGDNMVLQRNTDIAIWGKDTPNTKIKIRASWGASAKTHTDVSGTWRTTLNTTDAGGPYTLSVVGSTKVTLKNILLGEVWLASGQSNMDMFLEGFRGQPIRGGNDTILKSSNRQLRLYNVPDAIHDKEQFSNGGSWQISSPSATRHFSAVAYTFGKSLQETLDVPVGIILSSVGGTPVEAWTPRESLLIDYDDAAKQIREQQEWYSGSPSGLYNAMIHPLVPYTLKGVIWYQGEANVMNPIEYRKRFPALINSWRQRWNNEKMPFYFTQLAPIGWGSEEQPLLREAQLMTMKNTPYTGMAVTLDLGQKHQIHPSRKREIGERLAYWAFAKDYGITAIGFSGPIYESMSVTDGKATLTFSNAPNGVCTFDKPLSDFEVAGDDRIFHPAHTHIEEGTLTVWHPKVAKPVAVRYGWKNWLDGSLYGVNGLPAPSFRTDNW